MFRVLSRVTVDTLIVAAVLFLAAGTFAWPRAWALLVVLQTTRTISAIAIHRVNPGLLRERATVLVHHGQPLVDKIVLLTYMGTAFVGVPAIAALDVFHWHVLPTPPGPISSAGLALFIAGWGIIAIALRENTFAVTVVRHQEERRHVVVDSGIYGVIRHPMYAANPLVNVGLSLWLGSSAGALFAVVPLVLLLVRLRLEESFLRRELPGYRDYAARVPYRLVPRVW